MLKQLKLDNVGPAPSMTLELGKRLNLLTGDNGLGKSFLLDIAWWALTRKWPAEINAKLTSGKKAIPDKEGVASIHFTFTGKAKPESYTSHFDRREQAWTGRSGRPANPGLVLYAMSDGGFAVWDPARNYWKQKSNGGVQDRPAAYVFSPSEVWNGLQGEEGKWPCNGLIRDWAGWQKEKGTTFKLLCDALKTLSPSDTETLTPGELTSISLDDARDMPTIKMPYGPDVPLVHASAGMRRIIALAYLLVWAWEEHKKAATRILAEKPTEQVVFLIDEIECHLHPRWQFGIIPSLLKVMDSLTRPPLDKILLDSVMPPDVQVITTTHSPMILASVESVFDPKKDAWFDLDYVDISSACSKVILTHRQFEPHGDVTNWLTSEAFDLPSGRNTDYAMLLEDAASLIDKTDVQPEAIRAMNGKLTAALSPKDPFLFRWRGICAKKGWLQSPTLVIEPETVGGGLQ